MKNGQRTWYLMGGLLTVAGLMIIGWHLFFARSSSSVALKRVLPYQEELTKALRAENRPEQAIRLYEQVASRPASNDEQRFQIGYARYQIGRLYAEQKRFRQARQAFTELASQRLSIPASPVEPGFGTWSEQGGYQAAICAYQTDPKEGLQQMIRFINRHPESPLVYGAYKRILRWTKEQPPLEAERAWKKVQVAQQERRKRAAACGPQALAYLLKQYGQELDWQTLMKECGTTEQGTDLWSLAEAARRRGFSCTGLEVSRTGLLEQVPPFLIWSKEGHYQVVETGSSGAWLVYDPQTGQRSPLPVWSLPEAWRGILLIFRRTDFRLSSETSTKEASNLPSTAGKGMGGKSR